LLPPPILSFADLYYHLGLSSVIFFDFTLKGIITMLRKAIPVVFISMLGTVSHAATTTSTDNSLKVAIPSLKPGFEFNIGALWLKPGASNLNYVIYNQELPAQSPAWNEKEVNPSFNSAFELGGRYFFSSGNDINLDWTHLNSSNSSSIAADNVNFFLGPDFEIGPDGIPIRNATGTAKFKYDVVNLDVGQFVSFGQYVQMRFFGGLSTGFLREEVIANYTGTTLSAPLGPFSMNQDVISNFTGVGPRFGIHVDVNTNCGFGFLGETGISALIGSMYSKTAYTSSAPLLLATYGQTINNQIIEDQRVYQVIPGIDAKLGIKYKHAFKKSLLTISAGYQAAVYFNAISQYIPQSLVTPLETGGIFVATMNHTLSNYSVQGPFLNFALEI
jgi:hypothetical protein